MSKKLYRFDQYVLNEAKKKKLDPIGEEDADIDNDGKVTKSDTYIKKRRDARAEAIEARLKIKKYRDSLGLDEEEPKKKKKKAKKKK